MSLYPSLEDMKVDQLTRAQLAHMQQQQQQQQQQQLTAGAPSAPPSNISNGQPVPPPPYSVDANGHESPAKYAGLYPSLGDYMGLELTPEIVAQYVPQAVAIPQPSQVAVHVPAASTLSTGMLAPLSGTSLGLKRAEVSHGIREIILCKDAKGKIGIRVKDISKGVFVVLVQKGSPAALAGLRFGDQILQVNGANVAGHDSDKMHSLFRKCPANNIVVAVRDRPYERTITMHKDSTGHIGFLYKNGKIHSIVKDSSAARNGVLTDHQILEVNGQNVIGLKDKEITQIFAEGGSPITITIMPSFIYDHMMKNIASFLIKETMDHSIKDI